MFEEALYKTCSISSVLGMHKMCSFASFFSCLQESLSIISHVFARKKVPKSVDFVLHPSNSEESKDASKQDINSKETVILAQITYCIQEIENYHHCTLRRNHPKKGDFFMLWFG